MNMELKLYRCAHCGNIAFKVVDKGVPLMCCGQKMEELVPNTTDGALEKHVPQITREGNHVTIQVGSTIHPMLEEHYIQLIAAVSGNKVTFQLPKPGDEPVLKAGGAEPVTAYEYCNLHGFWKAQE